MLIQKYTQQLYNLLANCFPVLSVLWLIYFAALLSSQWKCKAYIIEKSYKPVLYIPVQYKKVYINLFSFAPF